MIRVNDDEYWLYGAVDPATNEFLDVNLTPTYTIAITRQFLADLIEKHDLEDAEVLVDDAPEIEGALREAGLTYRVEPHGRRNPTERVSR